MHLAIQRPPGSALIRLLLVVGLAFVGWTLLGLHWGDLNPFALAATVSFLTGSEG